MHVKKNTDKLLFSDQLQMQIPDPLLLQWNIYTPSVFCYDKHKKNFDIQFSMKRHETV